MKVEHIIRNIKKFNIMAHRYHNHRKRFGLRLNLVCGIVNYEKFEDLFCYRSNGSEAMWQSGVVATMITTKDFGATYIKISQTQFSQMSTIF